MRSLNFRSHPTWSATPEATTMTFLCSWSDKPVYTTTSIRPIGPCQPSLSLAGHIFSHLWNPYPTVPGILILRFVWTPLHRGGGFPDFGYLDPFRHKLRISSLELKAVISALNNHWATVLQGHQVMIATDNTREVSNTNKQGGPILLPCFV